ncbi:MAG: ISAzo13 family transposase, partial [Puniceicoccales bacterium]|nr:ISAzo13 family transposase [Puniceicoccales bacterium]
KGLKVQCGLDTNPYPTGIKVTPEEISKVLLTPHDFHGDWNYTIETNIPPKL